MSYWQNRMANAQSKLTSKSIKEIEKTIAKYYKDAAIKVMDDFEATYNKLLAAIEEGREPTPADLYKLDKYWQMQGQLRQELRKLGEKQVVPPPKKPFQTVTSSSSACPSPSPWSSSANTTLS